MHAHLILTHGKQGWSDCNGYVWYVLYTTYEAYEAIYRRVGFNVKHMCLLGQ